MDRLWWQLPGPSRFLSQVQEDFRAGRNTVLVLAEHGPSGLAQALTARVRDDGWSWRAINTNEESVGEDPASYLHRRFAPLNDGEPCSPQSLAGSEAFSNMILWVDCPETRVWERWRRFLCDYEHACRMRPEAERALFCICAVATPPENLPGEDVALSVRHWKGVVGRLDMTLYLTHLLDGRLQSALHRKIAASVGAELAGSDGELARQWARLDLADMLEPMPFLIDVGKARGWTVKTSRDWRLGTWDELDGQFYPHSALLAVNGDAKELNRRIWRGQVGVIFPFIEEQRVRLIEEIGSCLPLPFQLNDGVISDPLDLEIGQILFLSRKAAISGHTRSVLSRLTQMRHSMAHLEPVASECLTSPEIRSLIG